MLSRYINSLIFAECRFFATSDKLKDSFRFPSHKAYFNDHYLKMKYPTSRKIEGMTMRAYKNLFKNPNELPVNSWTTEKEKLGERVKEYISKSDPGTMIKTTKEILKRAAVKRDFNFTEEEKEKFVMNQYGDYDKYLKNYTEVKDAPIGEKKDQSLVDRFREIREITDSPETKKNFTKLPDHYEKMVNYIWGAKLERFKDFRYLSPPDEWNLNSAQQKTFDALLGKRMRGENHLKGRLSPWAKQEIYNLHLQGWSVNDLSMKFGILPARTRACLIQRHIFWNEIYPRLGETALRMGTFIELLYGEQFGFRDYGLDLAQMSKHEKSLKLTEVSRQKADRDFEPVDKRRIIEFYKQRRPNMKYTFIPERYEGKIPKGYIIKRLHVWKGNGRVRPTNAFMDSVRYSSKEDRHLLADNIVKKLNLGPKRASRGHTPLHITN